MASSHEGRTTAEIPRPASPVGLVLVRVELEERDHVVGHPGAAPATQRQQLGGGRVDEAAGVGLGGHGPLLALEVADLVQQHLPRLPPADEDFAALLVLRLSEDGRQVYAGVQGEAERVLLGVAVPEVTRGGGHLVHGVLATEGEGRGRRNGGRGRGQESALYDVDLKQPEGRVGKRFYR